jgi:hypothetical protein
MPPPAVKTVEDLIFWQYAKIISESAHQGKTNYGFIMSKFKKLHSGEIHWSTSIREYIKERENQDHCIYCGGTDRLTLDHILPKSRGGVDSSDNAVWVCQRCNSSKGSKRLYEWKGLKNKDNYHRIAEGKYLKLLHKLHEEMRTLNISEVEQLCIGCDMQDLCKRDNVVGELTVYCLEGCFKKI